MTNKHFIHLQLDQVRPILPALELLPSTGHSSAGKMDQFDLISNIQNKTTVTMALVHIFRVYDALAHITVIERKAAHLVQGVGFLKYLNFQFAGTSQK